MSILEATTRMIDEWRNVRPDAQPISVKVLGQGAPTLPPRPAPPAAIPQTLEAAQAALATLQAAGAEIRTKVLLDPDLARPPENFQPGAAKAFLMRWCEDTARCVRDAATGQDLTILQCGDLGRIDRALNGIFGDERPGAIAQQGRVVTDLQEQQMLAEYSKAEPELRKMDLGIAKTLLKLCEQWQARIDRAQKIRRPARTPAHPQLRTIGDQTARLVKMVGNTKNPEELI